MKKWIFAIMAIFIVFAFTGCPEPEVKDKVTITFDANTTDSVSGLPSPMKIDKGGSIGTIPAGPTCANWEFGGWFLEKSTATQLTTSTKFNADTTVFAKWNPQVAEGKVRVSFNANGGSVTPTYVDIDKDAAVGDSLLPVPTFAGHTFLGWFTAATGGTAFTAATTVAANIEVFARWEVVTVTGDAEILALGNGGTALFAFTIPEGATWGDYAALSYKVKLVYPEQADQNHPAYTNLYRARLFGPYDQDDMDGKTVFPSGGFFDGITYVTDTGMTLTEPANADDIKAYAMRFVANAGKDSFMHGWIVGNKANDAADYNAALGTPDASGWYTLEFDFSQISTTDANSPKNAGGNAGLQWPGDNATGTFYFGLGLIGGNNQAIVQMVKDVQLVGYQGVDPVISTGSGFDKPAYAANVVGETGALVKFSPRISDVWRSTNDTAAEPPIYVAFSDGFEGGGKAIRWTNKGGTLPNVPDATRTGYIFKGWAAAEGQTSGATVTDANVFNVSTVYYAAWEVDTGYVEDPKWNELTNKYEMPAWTTTANSTRQNTWLTYGGGGVYQPLSIDDLRNAVYLVFETSLPTTDTAGIRAGGSIGFVAQNTGFPGTRRDIFNGGASTHASTEFIREDAKTIVVINLKEALLPADLTALNNTDTKWGQVALQYWDGDNGFNKWTDFKAYLLFKDGYTIKSPMSTTFACSCDACKTEFPAGCACTIACLSGCTDCGVCSLGSQWKCPCPDCANLYIATSCDCTEVSCNGTCKEGCLCWVQLGKPVGTVYQTPAAGDGFFYLNLNDYKTRSNPGANGADVPAATVAADKITLTYTENGQRASFRLTDAQKAILMSSAEVSIEIVGTATPDTSFRYHIGSPALGGSWNASSGTGDGAFSAIKSTKHTWGENKNANTVGWLILQQRAAATTEVVITSIKITAAGIQPERVTAPVAGTLFTYEGTGGWAGANTTQRFYADSGKTYLITGDARNGHAAGAGTLNAEFAGAAAAMEDYGASYSRYIYQIPQEIFDNLARYQNMTLSYDLIKVSTRADRDGSSAPQIAIKDNNGAAGGGATMVTELAFGTGKTVTIDAVTWLTGYNDGQGNAASSDRHLGIVPQSEDYVMLLRVTSITFGTMAAYVEPDFAAIGAAVNSTLFTHEGTAGWAGANTTQRFYVDSGKTYLITGDARNGHAAGAGTLNADFAGAAAAMEDYGASYSRYIYQIPQDIFDKLGTTYKNMTFNYDLIKVSTRDGRDGSTTPQIAIKDNNGAAGGGATMSPNLVFGTGKAVTISAETWLTGYNDGQGNAASSDRHLGIVPQNEDYVMLLRVTSIVFW